MSHYSANVPYLGFVDWSTDDLRGYARDVAIMHRPTRRWTLMQRRCAACHERWPCQVLVWAVGNVRGVDRR
jgi:hypothetical protein